VGDVEVDIEAGVFVRGARQHLAREAVRVTPVVEGEGAEPGCQIGFECFNEPRDLCIGNAFRSDCLALGGGFVGADLFQVFAELVCDRGQGLNLVTNLHLSSMIS
jgi:hypothetical protein